MSVHFCTVHPEMKRINAAEDILCINPEPRGGRDKGVGDDEEEDKGAGGTGALKKKRDIGGAAAKAGTKKLVCNLSPPLSLPGVARCLGRSWRIHRCTRLVLPLICRAHTDGCSCFVHILHLFFAAFVHVRYAH